MLGEIAQQAGRIGLTEQRRASRAPHTRQAEGIDREPEGAELLGAVQQLLDRRLVELDDLGDQQDLPLHAFFRSDAFSLS